MQRTSRGVVVDHAELSDPGRDPDKQVNEDSCRVEETPLGLLAVVADGMGGHDDGQVASKTAVDAIFQTMMHPPTDAVPSLLLRESIEAAATAVYALGGDAHLGARPGSTCVALLVNEQGALPAHVGDSRILLLRGGRVQRLTRDHSMVQEMVDAGLITQEEATHHPEANKITRALGMSPHITPDVAPGPTPLERDDVLLLCSDGLTDLVTDDELAQLVGARLGAGPDVVVQALVDLANHRGGHDNITVQLLRVTNTAARPVGKTKLLEKRRARHPMEDTVPDRPPATQPGGGPTTAAMAAVPEHGGPVPAGTPLGTTVGGASTGPGGLGVPAGEPRPSAPGAPPSGPGGLAVLIGGAMVAVAIVGAVLVWGVMSSLRSVPDVPAPPIASDDASATPPIELSVDPGEVEPPAAPSASMDGPASAAASASAAPAASAATPQPSATATTAAPSGAAPVDSGSPPPAP